MLSRFIGLCLTAAIALGAVSGARAITPEEAAVLETFRSLQGAKAFQEGADGRQARLTGQNAPPAGCISVVSTWTPTGATVTTTVRRTLAAAGMANSFDLTYWRTACANDTTKSAVLVRLNNIVGGKVFLCGTNLKGVQGGVTYNTTTLLSSGANPYAVWCDYLSADQTFVLGQWPQAMQYDTQAAFDLTYDFILHEASTATVPAYAGGGSTSTPITSNPVAGPLFIGWWWSPAEGGRGWGIGQHASTGALFLGGFLYDSNGDATWAISNLALISTGSVTVNGVAITASLYQGDLIYCRDGQPIEMTTPTPPTCTAAGSVALETSGARNARLTITRTGSPAAMVTNLVPYDSF